MAANGDGDGSDITGAITFRSGSGGVALKPILPPDQFQLLVLDIAGRDSGVRIDVVPFDRVALPEAADRLA